MSKIVSSPLIFVINQELNNWKMQSEKNQTVPAFMVGINPSTGLFIYSGKDVNRDMIVATLRELLEYFDKQPGNSGSFHTIIN